MITKIEIESLWPGIPELSLGGFMPNDDPVQIRNIDGLGPVKSEVSSSVYATRRGELFQGVSTGKRNLVLTLGLNPDWEDQTITSLRQLLYDYFMPENWTTFRIFSDELPIIFIRGIVESFEPNMFSLDPEIQISVLCPKPDFIEVDTTLVSGTIDNHTEYAIDYRGSVSSGFLIRIQPSDELEEYTGDLTIINKVRDVEQAFTVKDVTINSIMYLQINTVRTTREIFNIVVSGDRVLNILGKMEIGSIWPEFLRGENVLSFVTDTPGLTWKLGYFNRYGGL